MIRPIVKDVFFLRQKSAPATRADLSVAEDLQDTLLANRDRCVGMAANMIGVRKRIIIVNIGLRNLVMINPVITEKSAPFVAEESCLSLTGQRKATRYGTIAVEYTDVNWKQHKEVYTGWTAQIIQHECDHLEGIII